MFTASEDSARRERETKMASRPWFHSIDVGDGLVTPGRVPLDYLRGLTRRMRWPDRFDGLSVLDIGAWDGFFSFEAERRGAARVVAYDLAPADHFGFAVAKELIGSRAEYVQGSVYDLSPKLHGTYDVVFFFGVFYHLRYPLLALDRIWEVTRQCLWMETQVLDEALVLPDRRQVSLRQLSPRLAELALFQFYRHDELAGDYSNWFAPNRRALEDCLASAGFRPEYLDHWQQRIAFKAERLPAPPECHLDSYEGLSWRTGEDGRQTLHRLTRAAPTPAEPPPASVSLTAPMESNRLLASGSLSLDELRAGNDRLEVTRPDLAPYREHNHFMIDVLHQLRPLHGQSVLDLGGAPQGWALERALACGASRYLGIGLDIADRLTVEEEERRGELRPGNAESLDLPDASFDLVFSLSTFEHFADGRRVLREMHRVLRPGGRALVSFEPVWTAAHGHHLHHIPGGQVVPPWSHLLLDPDEMRRALEGRWPADSPVGLEEAVRRIYFDGVINRVPLEAHRRLFAEGPLEIEWSVPLRDENPGRQELAEYLATLLPYSADDLLTRGLTLWLAKADSPTVAAAAATGV